MNFIKCICFSMLAAFSLFLEAGTQEQMLADLDRIRDMFQVSYAPAEWKNTFAGWSLDLEIDKVKAEIASSDKITSKQFQRLVKKFMNTTKDYHVDVLFYSTEKASLPFRVKGAGNKYFISYINRKQLSRSNFPFTVGDELVAFDGRPVNEVIHELMLEEKSSNEQTDKALAEGFLTERFGKRGHVVPKGPITVSVLPKGSSKPKSHQLIWNYKKEKIASAPKAIIQSMASKPRFLRNPNIKKKSVLADPIFHKLLVAECDDFLTDDDEDEDLISARNGFIPALGRIWWESSEDSPFKAYLFELDGPKLVGYIRIPSYLPPGSFEDDEIFKEYAEEFANIISLMEERSDALVIDEVDNPGGSLFYLYALAAMLTDQPLTTPKHRIAITQADVHKAYSLIPLLESIKSDEDAQNKLGESLSGNSMNYQLTQFILNFFYYIIDEWNAGRQVTNPYYLYGIDHINPNTEVQYTKPILVLINSLDFSGADFFAAILQDNHRAVTMGTRTAGAGGFTTKLKYPNLNGIARVRLTASIAERSNKNPIENLGVVPDIACEITENDLRYDYDDYKEAICKTLIELIKK